jgi:hypothetical protein
MALSDTDLTRDIACSSLRLSWRWRYFTIFCTNIHIRSCLKGKHLSKDVEKVWNMATSLEKVNNSTQKCTRRGVESLWWAPMVKLNSIQIIQEWSWFNNLGSWLRKSQPPCWSSVMMGLRDFDLLSKMYFHFFMYFAIRWSYSRRLWQTYSLPQSTVDQAEWWNESKAKWEDTLSKFISSLLQILFVCW